jgi:hypothetical protein
MSQNKSTKHQKKKKKKSILIGMMVLETLLDIELELLNSSTDRTNLPLNRADILLKRAQCSHNLSISSIIMRRLRSSLRRGSSCRYLKLNKWRLRSVILTFMPQLAS